MPDSTSGCRLGTMCWVERGATNGIRPKPIDALVLNEPKLIEQFKAAPIPIKAVNVADAEAVASQFDKIWLEKAPVPSCSRSARRCDWRRPISRFERKANTMSARVSCQGVFPAVTTQFREDFSLDMDATATVIDGLIRDGVSGLVVCGTVGENTLLSRAEKLQVIEAAKSVAAGRVR